MWENLCLYFFLGTISIPSIEFENVRGTPVLKLWFMWDVGKEEMRCLMFSYMDFPQLTMTLPDMMWTMEPLKFHGKLIMVAFLLQMGGREQGGRGSHPRSGWYGGVGEGHDGAAARSAILPALILRERRGQGRSHRLYPNRWEEECETGRKIEFMRVVRVCVGQVFNGPSPKNSAKQITNEILYCKKMFVTIKMIPF